MKNVSAIYVLRKIKLKTFVRGYLLNVGDKVELEVNCKKYLPNDNCIKPGAFVLQLVDVGERRIIKPVQIVISLLVY